MLVISCAPKGSATFQHKQKISIYQNHDMVRTSQFESLVGRGAIEFKWEDDSGKHKEQGDLDFWKQGRALSLRVSKLGELLLWFGGEGEEYWLFNMMGEEPTLTYGGHVAAFSSIDVALILLGLEPLPTKNASVHDSEVRSVDQHGRQWSCSYSKFTQQETVHELTNTMRPIRICMKDADHEAEAVHLKGIKVEIPNLHELYWPQTGGNIDIKDNQNESEIKIVFDFISTVVEEEPMERVMNVEFLKSALQPTVVEQRKLK